MRTVLKPKNQSIEKSVPNAVGFPNRYQLMFFFFFSFLMIDHRRHLIFIMPKGKIPEAELKWSS